MAVREALDEWRELSGALDRDDMAARVLAMAERTHVAAFEAGDYRGCAAVQKNLMRLAGLDAPAGRQAAQVLVNVTALPSVAGNYGLPSETQAQPVDVRTEAAAEPVPTGDE